MTWQPGCLPHVPHKDWADDRERQNYEAIEQWAVRLHDGWVNGTVQPGQVTMPLHLPAKNWSGNRQEFENCLAIERWAEHFQRECLVRAIPTPPGETLHPEARLNTSLYTWDGANDIPAIIYGTEGPLGEGVATMLAYRDSDGHGYIRAAWLKYESSTPPAFALSDPVDLGPVPSPAHFSFLRAAQSGMGIIFVRWSKVGGGSHISGCLSEYPYLPVYSGGPPDPPVMGEVLDAPGDAIVPPEVSSIAPYLYAWGDGGSAVHRWTFDIDPGGTPHPPTYSAHDTNPPGFEVPIPGCRPVRPVYSGLVAFAWSGGSTRVIYTTEANTYVIYVEHFLDGPGLIGGWPHWVVTIPVALPIPVGVYPYISQSGLLSASPYGLMLVGDTYCAFDKATYDFVGAPFTTTTNDLGTYYFGDPLRDQPSDLPYDRMGMYRRPDDDFGYQTATYTPGTPSVAYEDPGHCVAVIPTGPQEPVLAEVTPSTILLGGGRLIYNTYTCVDEAP